MDDVNIKETRNYDAFKLIASNRELGRGHVERLKKAFEERGNLTRVQPILVNERMEIVDGQHRFLAAKELEQPIFYIEYPGLGIGDARSMNILHKSWDVLDYAHSYATSGDASYRRYLELRDETGVAHSVLLSYVNQGDVKGIFSEFRDGEFILSPERAEEVKRDLDKFEEIRGLMSNTVRSKTLSIAFLKCLRTPEYDHSRMVRKLQQVGSTIPSFSSILDYQRALEEAYNRGVPEANKVRLF